MTTRRPHWAVIDTIENGQLSVEQRDALADLLAGIGALASGANNAAYRNPQDHGMNSAAWREVLVRYDRLVAAPPVRPSAPSV